MKHEWLSKIPYLGATLYFVLAGIRTVYEATWDPSPWCENYAGVMLFYAVAMMWALATPRSLDSWRKHAGKLTAGWVFLLILTTEVTNATYAKDEGVEDLTPGEMVGYCALAIFIGWIVSALVRQLGDHERRFELMSAGLSEALWSVNCVTDEVRFSESFARAFGYKPDQVQHSMSGWYSLVHSEDSARVEESFNAAARQPNQQVWEELYRVRRADGRYIWVLDRCRFDRNAQGVALVAYGGMLDVTDRIENERKLSKLNSELEMRVGERTRELEKANRELAGFTYSISHDLKSPLTGILGYAELMSICPAVSADVKLRTYLKHIVSSAERMSAFIHELLEHARIGEQAAVRTVVRLAPLFEDLRGEFSPQVGTRGGRLTLPSTDLCVLGAESLVYRILQNLVGNAFKYHRPRVPPVVIVTCEEKGGRVTISVRDNGLGIPAESLPHVFDFQYRVGAYVHIEGHGIGLANVKKAVTSLDGEISVESEPGVGSTFRIVLPAAHA